MKKINFIFVMAVILFSLNKVNATGKKKTTTYKKTAPNAAPAKAAPIVNEDNSPVPVELKSERKAAMIPAGNDYYSFLGKNINDEEVQNILSNFPGTYDLKGTFDNNNPDGTIFYTWNEKGFAFKVNSENVIDQIRFFNNKQFMGAPISQYPYQLPQGLNFAANRQQVENILGKPVEVSNPSGNQNLFANYLVDFNNYKIAITYKTPSVDDFNAPIDDIIIMKNEVTSANTNATPEVKPAQVVSRPNIIIDPSNRVNENEITPTVPANPSRPNIVIDPSNQITEPTGNVSKPANPSRPNIVIDPSNQVTEPAVASKSVTTTVTTSPNITIDPSNQVNQPVRTITNNSTDNSLYNLIGKNNNDPAVNNFISKMNDGFEMANYGDSYEMVNKESGVSLAFNNHQELKAIHLYNDKMFMGSNYKMYKGMLPEGFTFNSTKSEIESKLGQPIETSNSDNTDLWCVYKIPNSNFNLMITYNTRSKNSPYATIGDISILNSK